MATKNKIKELKAILKDYKKNAKYIEELNLLVEARHFFEPLKKFPDTYRDSIIDNKLQCLKLELVDASSKRHNVPMKDDLFIRLPKNFELVNKEQANTCDSAVAISVFNRALLNLPIFIYFYNENEKSEAFHDDVDQILQTKYPAYGKALKKEEEQASIEFSPDRFFAEKIMCGHFYIPHANPVLEHLNKCYAKECLPLNPIPAYEIAIYSGGDPECKKEPLKSQLD